MTKRAGRSQAPSEGVGDRAPQGGTSAAATTKAQQHLRVRAAGELGTDPLTCAWQLQGLGMERDADPVGRGMQQQALQGLPGEQPAQPPVLSDAQQRDHAKGMQAVRPPANRVPPPGTAREVAGGELQPVRLHRVGAGRHATEPRIVWRPDPADTLSGQTRTCALGELGRLDQAGQWAVPAGVIDDAQLGLLLTSDPDQVTDERGRRLNGEGPAVKGPRWVCRSGIDRYSASSPGAGGVNDPQRTSASRSGQDGSGSSVTPAANPRCRMASRMLNSAALQLITISRPAGSACGNPRRGSACNLIAPGRLEKCQGCEFCTEGAATAARMTKLAATSPRRRDARRGSIVVIITPPHSQYAAASGYPMGPCGPDQWTYVSGS